MPIPNPGNDRGYRPRVSVVLPTYNHERFLSEALDSVFVQTYGEYEVIVADDGSSDGTRRIVERLTEDHPEKVIYCPQENRGPGAARNLGIRKARGAYVAFLDDDDLWLPEKLERQVGVLDKNRDIGFAYTDNHFVDVSGRVLSGYSRTVKLFAGEVAIELFEHSFILTSGVAVRKECFERVGFFREDVMVGEDYDFLLRLAYHYRCAFIDEKLFKRRALESSLSSRDAALNAHNDIMILNQFLRERPGFAKKHAGRIGERLGSHHFYLGYHVLRRGRNLPALRHFILSLKYGLRVKTVKCMAMCLVPYRLVRCIRERLMRRLIAAGRGAADR